MKALILFELRTLSKFDIFLVLNCVFNNSPFLKKDLTMAGSYSFLQIHDFLVTNKSLSNEYLDEIMSTLYRKGINYSYNYS